ncbi:hypothetical protein ACRTAK_001315 [Clostridium perfringens]
MNNIKNELEVIQISIYTNIIKQIMKKHKNLSISKVMIFAYLIKKEKFMFNKVYTARNTQDVVCKAISLISGEYNQYCESLNYILKSIYLLIEKKELELTSGILNIGENIKIEKVIYEETNFLNKAIELSKKMSDRQFMKEVIENV